MWSAWSHVYELVVQFGVLIMILKGGPFNIVCYLAAWHHGVATLTSRPRLCRDNIPSVASDLEGWICAGNQRWQTQWCEQIQRLSCGFCGCGKSTSPWVSSKLGKTYAEAICTGPHPIKNARKKKKKKLQLIPFLHYHGFPVDLALFRVVDDHR